MQNFKTSNYYHFQNNNLVGYRKFFSISNTDNMVCMTYVLLPVRVLTLPTNRIEIFPADHLILKLKVYVFHI